MLSFQSPVHKFLITFLGMFTTHFAFTEALKGTCDVGFVNDGTDSVCWEKGKKIWSCPSKQCSYHNRRFAPMKGCTLDKTPGASSQQCTGYQLKGNEYQCWNDGDVRYMCPKAENTHFITCSECKAI